jgi:hypothetical protein
MAINLPIVTQFSDKGIKSAKAAFANFKTDVSAATGAMGKFKAGSNSALNAVKANAGALALAGGAAIAGFAVKAIGQFQDLALASGKFADATGLSVENASRWKEVGGDIGVGADSIQGAIGKMNKALGTTPELFKQLGVDVVRTDAGLTDVNGTFLAVIDRLREIKDPAERARVGALLLGKGWQEMAQFINLGSAELKNSLDSVSGAQVISAEELKRAREYRDTVDDLGDVWNAFVIKAGGAAVATINDFKEGTSSWEGFGNSLSRGLVGQAVSKITGLFNDNEEQAKETATEAKRLGDAYAGYVSSRLASSRGEIIKLNNAIEDESDALATLQGEWADLIGQLDVTVKLDNIGVALDELFTAGVNAFGGTSEEVRKFNEANLAATTQIAELAQALDLTSREEYSIKFAVDAGDLVRAQNILTSLTAAQSGGVEEMRFRGARANGGPVSGGGASYLVGERGPEIFTPSSSGMITPNSAIGGNTITVNVQGADPQAVVRALQDYNRTAGPIPVNTRAN